jgi:hypothetical protein
MRVAPYAIALGILQCSSAVQCLTVALPPVPVQAVERIQNVMMGKSMRMLQGKQ